MKEQFETIEVEMTDHGVLTVVLNRPEVLNAFNRVMCAEFARLWSIVRNEESIHVVVLGAAGQRAFSTGLDVSERLDTDANPWLDETHPWNDLEDPGKDLGPKRNGVWKPIIAAVDGMCAGGAFYWIAECDIVMCSPEATFFDPHVTYGMVATLEPIALTYRMHFSDALRMALMGLHERMGAESARACGLVTEIVDSASLFDRACEVAALLASQPSVAVQGTVKAMWQSLDLGRAQALDRALIYTQLGNPIATRDLDRGAARPDGWRLR